MLSSTLKSVPEEFAKHVQLASGSPNEIMLLAQKAGFENLYIDGGNTIQRFLNADAIDEMIITEVPILLGGGDRLFGTLAQQLRFELVDTEVLLGHLVKRHYQRKHS